MIDKTQNLESLMLLLCKTTSQHPMSDGQIASLKDIKLAEANAMLDKLYEAKAISSVTSIKDGKQDRLVWVTGLPYRPAPTLPKEVAWQHLRNQSTQAQPTIKPQETTMHTQTNQIIVPPNLFEQGIKTPQKIVRFLFANTKATSNQIRKNCLIDFVDPFIKAYVRKGYIERYTENKLAVYAITPKGREFATADALYAHAKVKQPKPMATPTTNLKAITDDHDITKSEHPWRTFIPEAGETALPLPAIADQANSASIPYEPLSQSTAESVINFTNSITNAQDEIVDDKQTGAAYAETTQTNIHPVRFALTSDGTLMILGVHYAPIELSKEDTKRLYDFAENTVHAI